MYPLNEVDDEVLETAWDLLNGRIEDGTDRIYILPGDSGEPGVAQYSSALDPQEIEPTEALPRYAMEWARTKTEIRKELDRRGLL